MWVHSQPGCHRVCRLGARSLLRTLPLEVMVLLLDKAAPAKFDLCLKL